LNNQIQHGIGELKKRCLELGNSVKYKSFDQVPLHASRNRRIEEAQVIVERIEKTYIFLEQIALNEAKYFSNHDKARLRNARSDVQRIRLWVYDVTGTGPSHHHSSHD